jgi:hypothetical protein
MTTTSSIAKYPWTEPVNGLSRGASGGLAGA